MTLSQEEKQLAAQLGLDESVLELIKKTLNPEMGIIKTGGLEEPEESFLKSDPPHSKAPLLAKDKENYLRLAKDYPVLEPAIKEALLWYDTSSQDKFIPDFIIARENAELAKKEELGPERWDRLLRYREARKPYESLIEQDRLEASKEQSGKKGPKKIQARQTLAFLETEEALQSEIDKLKENYSDKQLKEENRGKLQLAIKYKGLSPLPFIPTRKFIVLRDELEKLGYQLEQLAVLEKRRLFESKEEAIAFLKKEETEISQSSLIEREERTFEALFPVDLKKDFKTEKTRRTLAIQCKPYLKQSDTAQLDLEADILLSEWKATGGLNSLRTTLWIEPGSSVKELGDRRWLIRTPARYEASAQTGTASIAKIQTRGAGFELVRHAGTCSDSLGPEDIIDKLQYWDKKYGVTVLSAGRDRMTIRLKNIPDDLSEFCTEYFLFDPECELSPNEQESAASMNELERKIRKTGKVEFWWD